MTPAPIVIATDGACQKNPGPAGWAWVADDGRWQSGSLRHGTNNIGELLGLVDALDVHSDAPDLTLLIDSQYVIDSYSKWMDGWARRGWTTAAGAPVANQDLMQSLLTLRNSRRERGLPPVKLVKVKGHSGHVLNAWADITAVQAAARGAGGTESVEGTGHGAEPVNTAVLPAGATVRAPKRRGRR